MFGGCRVAAPRAGCYTPDTNGKGVFAPLPFFVPPASGASCLDQEYCRDCFPPAILALADGTVFRGKGIGAAGSAVGEVVFNTSMSGYQEILTDPSYCRQLVTLTYPHIGNTGVNDEDCEAATIHAAGLIIRDLPILASNWRLQRTLPDYLAQEGVVAIADIDTRRLTRVLREKARRPAA